jgi:fatty acid desaturase
MAVYDFHDRPDFFSLQVTTTRNVDDGWFVGWFMGGLQYQVEHHIFPYVPRHNLPKTRQLVEALCKKHRVPYKSTSLTVGTIEVLKHLGEVTEHVLRDFPAM